MTYEKDKKYINIADAYEIHNIYALEKIGAGHDGRVFRYKNLALKYLKYDMEIREEKNLMTYEKAKYFTEWSYKLKRILAPLDLLYDENHAFCGYAMQYIESIDDEFIQDFLLSSLLEVIEDLKEDFDLLNKKKTIVKDVNRGSYIFSKDFMYLCDTDKYIIFKSDYNTIIRNQETLNFIIAKFLYMLMYDKELNYEMMRKLSTWVRKCSSSLDFLKNLEKEIMVNKNDSIKSYTNYLKRKLLKRN